MESIWEHEVTLPERKNLPGNIEREAVVIGGGLCGILTGYYLQNAGVKTVILEADRIGSGQTGKTTGKITSQHGCAYARLVSRLGRERARQYAQGNQYAVTEYGRLIRREKIDCDFHRCAAYLYSVRSSEEMEREAAAAAACGIHGNYTEETELPFPVKGAVRFSGQARFSPLKFLEHLSRELEIYEHTKVVSAEHDRVMTNWGTVKADYIIFACHYPFVNFPGFYFMRMYQQRSYVLALKDAFLPEHMYLGVDPDHSYSFRTAGDHLLLGGEGHRTGEHWGLASRYEKLGLRARTWWPRAVVTDRWSAQDCMTMDGLPYIGRFSRMTDHWYVAAGFGKWGMTSSMVSALILSGMITGNTPEWAGVFSPSRLTPGASSSQFFSHSGKTAKNLAKAWLPPKEALAGLKPGEGKIVEWKGRKAGVYMDEAGGIYPVSPRCPHMGCQLTFNQDEKSWDCPCHGSRFSYKGELLDGPAQEGLKENG